jgi:fused signal recognition particle receptor
MSPLNLHFFFQIACAEYLSHQAAAEAAAAEDAKCIAKRIATEAGAAALTLKEAEEASFAAAATDADNSEAELVAAAVAEAARVIAETEAAEAEAAAAAQAEKAADDAAAQVPHGTR